MHEGVLELAQSLGAEGVVHGRPADGHFGNAVRGSLIADVGEGGESAEGDGMPDAARTDHLGG